MSFRAKTGRYTKRLATLSPVLFFASAAMAQEVSFNFEKDANFSAFETYAWVEIDDGQPLDEVTANQLRSAVEAELAMKGLRKADAAQADLLIAHQTALRKQREIAVYRSDWGYGPGWRAGGSGAEMTLMIPIGSLVLDMYLRSRKLLVWRGSVTKTVDVDAKPDKRERTIQKGVQKLLKNYPPPK